MVRPDLERGERERREARRTELERRRERELADRERAVHERAEHERAVHEWAVQEQPETPAAASPVEASVAEPSVAEPSVAEPSVAEPSVAEPSVAEPSAAEEIERIKQRVVRDGEREVERKTRELLVSFLDVVDDLDRALATSEAGGAADRALLAGVEMVRATFLDKLAAHGVQRSGEVGEAFDPARHEAIAIGPATTLNDEGRVLAVVRPGYRIGPELLRPASVVVGKRQGFK